MSPFVQKIIEHKEGQKTAAERVENLQAQIAHHQRSIEVLTGDLSDGEKSELAEWQKLNEPQPAPAESARS